MKSYIQIDGWKANIRFSAAHIIPEYEKCGRLHGHSYAINAKIYGSKDEKGIIVDFSQIKHILKDISEYLDHYILIPGENKKITITEENNQITLQFLDNTYMFPKQACRILPILSTSAENLAQYVLETFLDHLGKNTQITRVEIGVDEGYGQGAVVVKEPIS